MTITTRDGLVAAVAAAPLTGFFKPSGTTVAAFTYTTWRLAGTPEAGTAAPGTTGAALTRTSAGALAIQAAANTSYLSSFSAKAATAGVVILADRLVEFSGLSGITTGAQSVSAVSLPSRATGLTDVELWLEIYTLAGTTASATVTCSYTNSGGTSGRTATLIGGIPATGTPINRTYRFSLQAGDTGVQSVQSFSSGTSTGTAGSLGLTLRRSLVQVPIIAANTGATLGWPDTGLAIIGDNAALELLWQASGTSSGVLEGYVEIAQG